MHTPRAPAGRVGLIRALGDLQAVAESTDGLYPGSHVAELCAESSDMHVDRAGLDSARDVSLDVPSLLEELFPALGAAAPLHEREKKSVFGRCEIELGSIQRCLVGARVEAKRPGSQDPGN